MKFIAFILAITLMALYCIPCQDDDRFVKAGDIKTEQHKSHQPEHKDLCSPFCSCACCSVSSINTVAAFTTIPAPTTSIVFSDRDLGAILKMAIPVWQPPQLAI